MRDMKLNSFDEMLSDMYQVQWELGTAGFPRSHDGLEKAIKLAFDNGACVTFNGEVVWRVFDVDPFSHLGVFLPDGTWDL